MGCCCQPGDKTDPSGDYAPEEYQKERLHLSQGDTQIEVMNGNLHENKAQCLVSVIDNKGIGGGSDIILHNKDLKKQMKESTEEQMIHQYGTVVSKSLDDHGRLAIFLVLPLYKGGSEIEYLTTAIKNLINFIKDNSIKSLAIEEVGVKRLGYPRQTVISILVGLFDIFLKINLKSGVEQIYFVSEEMSSVALFEAEIQKIQTKVEPVRAPFSQEGEARISRASSKANNNQGLEQPLLSK